MFFNRIVIDDVSRYVVCDSILLSLLDAVYCRTYPSDAISSVGFDIKITNNILPFWGFMGIVVSQCLILAYRADGLNVIIRFCFHRNLNITSSFVCLLFCPLCQTLELLASMSQLDFVSQEFNEVNNLGRIITLLENVMMVHVDSTEFDTPLYALQVRVCVKHIPEEIICSTC